MMWKEEIYWSHEYAMNAALFICKHLDVQVSLKQEDNNGPITVSWYDLTKESN
jgi:hypothetical protein